MRHFHGLFFIATLILSSTAFADSACPPATLINNAFHSLDKHSRDRIWNNLYEYGFWSSQPAFSYDNRNWTISVGNISASNDEQAYRIAYEQLTAAANGKVRSYLCAYTDNSGMDLNVYALDRGPTGILAK